MPAIPITPVNATTVTTTSTQETAVNVTSSQLLGRLQKEKKRKLGFGLFGFFDSRFRPKFGVPGAGSVTTSFASKS